MARSLRDELLRAGLVTGEQAARAERGRRTSSKPAGGKAACHSSVMVALLIYSCGLDNLQKKSPEEANLS